MTADLKAVSETLHRIDGKQPDTAALSDGSEDGLAIAFITANSDLRWVESWSSWYRWNNKVWERDQVLAVYDVVRRLLRTAASDDQAQAKTLKKATTVAAVERLARCDRRAAATIEQWDREPWLLNTTGGMVDLRTGEISSHDSGLYMTKLTACAPAVVNAARWLSFLQEVTAGDQALTDFLQRGPGTHSPDPSGRMHCFSSTVPAGTAKGCFWKPSSLCWGIMRLSHRWTRSSTVSLTAIQPNWPCSRVSGSLSPKR